MKIRYIYLVGDFGEDIIEYNLVRFWDLLGSSSYSPDPLDFSTVFPNLNQYIKNLVKNPITIK